MVEAGKKYRHKDWTQDFVIVNCVGKGLFLGDLPNGQESWFYISEDWIEIKQRPRTLLDCHKAGMAGDEKQFGPRKVVLAGKQDNVQGNLREVCVRGAEKNEPRWAHSYMSDHANDVIMFCGSELSDWLVWPIEMIEE